MRDESGPEVPVSLHNLQQLRFSAADLLSGQTFSINRQDLAM